MENLPLLFLRELFNMLPDLNAAIRCSHVCRNWKAAYETMIRTETLCLNFETTIPEFRWFLGHRLFYTNERVSKLSFLKPSLPSEELRFFDSPSAIAHFANIKKLVIFNASKDYYNFNDRITPEYKFPIQNQLSSFKRLEYVEITWDLQVLEGCEIDLPLLKALCFNQCYIAPKNSQIILRTPSLEALNIVSTGDNTSVKISNLKFVFPSALRHLEMSLHKANFKFKTNFKNLEILFLRGINYEVRDDLENGQELLANDFLKKLRRLEFVLFERKPEMACLDKLEAQKEKYNLDDLEMYYDSLPHRFDYENWSFYTEYREQLRYWPGELNLRFHKLIEHQVSLGLFKEGYFKIERLKVRQVDNQAPLVDLLRKVRVPTLQLDYDCNLGQSFFDEIADSAIVFDRLKLEERLCNRLNDPSVLTRLNVFVFDLSYQHFPSEASLALLRNRTSFRLNFFQYEELYDWGEEDGILRQEPNTRDYHRLIKTGNDFYCSVCEWVTCKESNYSQDPLGVVLKHAAIEGKESNLDCDEKRKYYNRFWGISENEKSDRMAKKLGRYLKGFKRNLQFKKLKKTFFKG